MLDRLKIITVTHKQTQLNRLAGLAIQAGDEETLQSKLYQIKSHFNLDEFFYMATCNRVMYCFLSQEKVDRQFLRSFTDLVHPGFTTRELEENSSFFQVMSGEKAIEHLFEVAASIDSLVIGERQILRQLREAYEKCADLGLTGDGLRIMVQQAVLAAKSVYSNTKIGEKSVSVVALAIRELNRIPLSPQTRILFIGAGQTNELAAKILTKQPFANITVFNRTLERAEKLVRQIGGKALPLDALPDYSGGFDVMIVCTGAQKPVITPHLYNRLLAGESGEKVVIDLAVPNNVHPEVPDSFPIRYIEIEGLRQVARINHSYREEEVKKARAIIKSFLDSLPHLLKQRQAELAFRSVPDEVKAVKQRALNEVFRSELAQLDASTLDLVERMMTYMEKKCVSIPMRVAKESTVPL